MSVNKAILVGRLGKDPEVRYTSGGQSVANFSLATDEVYKDHSGEKIKKTEWHNIVAWGAVVENFISQYLHKGDMVYVEGKLQTRSWEDKKNGGTRYTTEIVLTTIRGLILNNAGQSEAAPTNTGRQTQSRPAQARPAQGRPTPRAEAMPTEINDEDIPF